MNTRPENFYSLNIEFEFIKRATFNVYRSCANNTIQIGAHRTTNTVFTRNFNSNKALLSNGQSTYLMARDSILAQFMDQQTLQDQSFLQSALNLVATGVHILEAIYRDEVPVDFKYVFVNEAGKRFLPAPDVTGKSYNSINGNPEVIFQKMVRAIQSRSEIISEESFTTESGNCICKVRLIPVLNGILLFFEDTAEVSQLKNIIKDQDQKLSVFNAELRSFNSVVATDYKQTLQSLYTNLEFIIGKEAVKLSDASKANIRRAQAAIQRMKLLTDDINTFLHLYEVGVNPAPIDPNPVLENVISQMTRKVEQSDATFEIMELPPLNADPLLLSWLFSNLLDNCIKFRKMVVSPVIKIKYSLADEMNAIPSARQNMRYVIISVSDNGIGFADTQSERIFELFYRIQDKTYYRGSGVGLTICKKIMELHGGFITAEGKPAQGATFNCYFPVD
jgi:signal transduction histidine kinase